jgi:Zn-dependent protease
MLGWAKPTPVDPRNFKNAVKDDILTSVAGPISNFIVVMGALSLLLVISLSSELGHQLVQNMPMLYRLGIAGATSESPLVPATLFLYELMWINIVLGVFNLIPVPPLDGSHVLRHFLSDSARRVYDGVGWFALLALVYLGGGLLGRLIYPVIGFFNSLLMR